MLKVLFLVLCLSLQARVPEGVQLQDFECHGISYEWETTPDAEALLQVAVDACYECYKEIPLEELGFDESVGLRASLEGWRGETERLIEGLVAPNSQFRLIEAKSDGVLVGYAHFDLSAYPEFIYLSELAVDPKFQRQRIGKHLVFSILDSFSEAKKLVLVTRKANAQACAFYPAIGFQDSDYVDPHYSSELYRAFEYVVGLDEEIKIH